MLNMDNVVISIDGRKESHDTVRHDCNGKGSDDKIVPLAQKLVAGRAEKSYFVRGTFTAKNKDFSNDVMHLARKYIERLSTDDKLCVELMNNTIFEKEKCEECWAKLFCSGGCHANSFFTNATIKEPNEMSCMLQKKRKECALMINASACRQSKNLDCFALKHPQGFPVSTLLCKAVLRTEGTSLPLPP